jgi:transaldolase
MKATQLLHKVGQSLWLDNITRALLNDGTLKRYINDLSVTGLTSNPTIFDHAIKNSSAYDGAIRAARSAATSMSIAAMTMRSCCGSRRWELVWMRLLLNSKTKAQVHL